MKADNVNHISEWKSKGLSNTLIKPPNNSLVPILKFTAEKIYLDFAGSCLKQDRSTLNHRKTVKIYIVYELIKTIGSFSFALNCLFGEEIFHLVMDLVEM